MNVKVGFLKREREREARLTMKKEKTQSAYIWNDIIKEPKNNKGVTREHYE